MDYGLRNLAPIREDLRSAERVRRAESYEARYVAQPRGYNQPQSQLDVINNNRMTPVNKNKENILRLPVINEKPTLQRQASAILGGVI
jgi:hypothetical protein